MLPKYRFGYWYEEQLAPAVFIPAMTMNDIAPSTQLKFQASLLPETAHFQAGESLPLMQGEVSQTVERTATKPVMSAEFVGKKDLTRTMAAKTLTQPDVVQQGSDVIPSAALSLADKYKPVVMKTALPLLSPEGQKQDVPNVSLNAAQLDGMAREANMASSALGRELATAASLAQKNDSAQKNGSAQGNELPLEQFPQQLTVQAPSLTNSTEVKAPVRALPEAFVADGEPTIGNRTLSYTFTQWKNSPVVTFELSGAGELTAMTNSAEVQQALQENHHLLTSDNPLHFRDDEQNKERREQQQTEHEDEA